MPEWVERVPAGYGSHLTYEDFYISYNPMDRINTDLSMFGSDNASAETALVIGDDYVILNGDYRAEFQACGDDLDKCWEVVKLHDRSTWSD